ncbi:MAG TPA: GFA family protein [Kofleriaceae bacterium]|nr:GFA family protein [Kofleriaceae bacterium]
MSQPSTYTGSCHCGAVRYTVELDLSQPVMSCNCSMCGRAGTLLAFAPIGKFKLEQGSESLTDYQFHKHVIHHMFCKVCGIKSFARGTGRDGSEMAAINVRCLEGVDPTKLTIQQVDGRSL